MKIEWGKFMLDIKNNENNKEKKLQGKKSPASIKIVELIKPQPDQVDNSKKMIEKTGKDGVSKLGEKIKKLSDKNSIPESDIEIIINNIDWDELKKSCADFYVNVTRNNPFKIYLKITWIQVLSATISTSEKYLIRSFKTKTFSWPVIQFFNSSYNLFSSNGGKISIFWKVLSDKPISIFV